MPNELLCMIDLPESPIPDGCPRQLIEVTIRRHGCIWRVHKNDSDPYPSNPHAHNIESGLTMDLTNGSLYLGRKSTKMAVDYKHLLDIRVQAEQKGVLLPPLSIRKT